MRIVAHESGRQTLLFGTGSSARHEMLKAPPYRYDGLVDYREPHWVESFLNMEGGVSVQYAIDCISEGDSVRNVSQIVAAGGSTTVSHSCEGKAWSMEPGELPFQLIYGVVWEGLGVEVEYQGKLQLLVV